MLRNVQRGRREKSSSVVRMTIRNSQVPTCTSVLKVPEGSVDRSIFVDDGSTNNSYEKATSDKNEY
jgi:hypothetical protein